MISAVTHSIKVSVETFYQEEHSFPKNAQYLFAYRIFITNNSNQAIQILYRHWTITDAIGIKREIEGEGVVGELPIILPNETYDYISGCNFITEIGKMKGQYLVKRLLDKKQFYVEIPEFVMCVPFKLN